MRAPGGRWCQMSTIWTSSWRLSIASLQFCFQWRARALWRHSWPPTRRADGTNEPFNGVQGGHHLEASLGLSDVVSERLAGFCAGVSLAALLCRLCSFLSMDAGGERPPHGTVCLPQERESSLRVAHEKRVSQRMTSVARECLIGTRLGRAQACFVHVTKMLACSREC